MYEGSVLLSPSVLIQYLLILFNIVNESGEAAAMNLLPPGITRG